MTISLTIRYIIASLHNQHHEMPSYTYVLYKFRNLTDIFDKLNTYQFHKNDVSMLVLCSSITQTNSIYSL